MRLKQPASYGLSGESEPMQLEKVLQRPLIGCLSDLVDVTDEHGRTPLMLAAQNRHPGVIELLTSSQLLSHKMGSQRSPVQHRNVDFADVYERTAFHRAAANGDIECMKLLLTVRSVENVLFTSALNRVPLFSR